MQTIRLMHQKQRSRRSLEPAEIDTRWLIKTINTPQVYKVVSNERVDSKGRTTNSIP